MIRIEFHVRVSLHINSFLWIVDVAVLLKETIKLDKRLADGLISAKLPDHNQYPELYKLIKTCQLHKHSKTCKKCGKFKNAACRFRFGTNKCISILQIN